MAAVTTDPRAQPEAGDQEPERPTRPVPEPLYPETLEQVLVTLLRDAARAQGLEV